jgi:hypothetical protein
MRHDDWESYQEGQPARTLHVYGPAHWHDEAHLVGNRAALEDLKRALEEALASGDDVSLAYAADGEGFGCTVILVEDDTQWQQIRRPYHGDLARDKREPDDVLAPTLNGSMESGPRAGLVRWRRWRSDCSVRLVGLKDPFTAAEVESLIEMIADKCTVSADHAREVVERLVAGERPVVMVSAPEEVQDLVAATALMGVAVETSPSRRGSE